MIGRRIAISLTVVAAVAAGGVLGAVLGVPALSGASETTTSQAPSTAGPNLKGGSRNTEFDAAAKALGLTTEQLRTKLSDGKTTIADVAKQQHVDINKVIDAMVGSDRQRIEKIVNNPWPGPGPGPGMKGGAAFGPRMGFGLGGPMALDAAAKALGLTTQELATQLQNGSTIAQIAKTKHVDVNKVIDAMSAEVNARIDQAQTNGRISKTQADAMKTKTKEAITRMVNNGMPSFPFGGRNGHRGGMGMPLPNTQPA
jgi:hypothetical protein